MVEIRSIEPDDWQGLYDLIEPVDKELVGMYGSTEDLVEEWINTIVSGVWEVYVAVIPQHELEDEPKGIVKSFFFSSKRFKRKKSGIVGVITLFGDWQEDEDLEEGEFDIGITVAEQYQRKGIGKMLMEFIIERGRELNYNKVCLWTREDNAPMKKLARRLGFRQGRKRNKHGFTWIKYFLEIKRKEEKTE